MSAWRIPSLAINEKRLAWMPNFEPTGRSHGFWNPVCWNNASSTQSLTELRVVAIPASWCHAKIARLNIRLIKEIVTKTAKDNSVWPALRWKKAATIRVQMNNVTRARKFRTVTIMRVKVTGVAMNHVCKMMICHRFVVNLVGWATSLEIPIRANKDSHTLLVNMTTTIETYLTNLLATLSKLRNAKKRWAFCRLRSTWAVKSYAGI